MLQRLSAFLYVLTSLAFAGVNEIPPYTPNVVDPAHQLSAEAVQSVNEMFREIREKADILGAVYIVDSLQDESIEQLAERAFRTWKLGIEGKDNGLLLVLAIKDRKSRFEVGYGLEGSLPDVYTRRALDEVLRPNMRKRDVKTAIVDSFQYLAALKTDGPPKEEQVSLIDRLNNDPDFLRPDFARGRWGLLVYLFCLWIFPALAYSRAQQLGRRLSKEYPDYDVTKDPLLNYGKWTPQYALFGNHTVVGSIAARGFFTLNPGVFVYFGSAMNWVPFGAFSGVALLVGLLYYRYKTKRYASKRNYINFLESLRRRNKRLVDLGYMTEKTPGNFEYTKAYYSSQEYRDSLSSSSSGSSSSDSSSSSGGGSSGGGGSSSSW